jgi:hypothetical protein
MYRTSIVALEAVVAALVALAACGGDARTEAPPGVDADAGGGGADAVPPPNEAGAPAADAPASDVQLPTTDGNYDHDGPIAYDVSVEHVTGASPAFDVTVYMPKSAGAHPAVSFSCGSSQTAAGYVPYGKRLASYGIAMILRDDPGALTKTTDIVGGAEYVVANWLPTALAGKVDSSHVGLGGHSRGGGVSLLAAEHGLKGKVVAWFGLDPVDNQFLINPGAYARTDIGSIGIPTAYLGASVTSNCAPAADSYPMLYPASPSPSVLVVGKGAGHTQLELPTACTACNICSPSGTADPNVVLAYAVRYFTAFFARELLGDASVGAAFEGAGASADLAAGRVTVTSK